jgi:hypothetical protein
LTTYLNPIMKRKPTRPSSDRSFPPEDSPIIGRHPDLSDEDFEAFMEMVQAFESAPPTTLARLLIQDGIALPCPDTFTVESVPEMLCKVIRAMARHRHFLYSTDHLSDLLLYRYLWEETLNDPTEKVTPAMGDCACHIDLVSDGSEDSCQLWLRHYAREDDRTLWAHDFPDEPIPDHVAPRYDRDRHLPKRSAAPDGGTDHTSP